VHPLPSRFRHPLTALVRLACSRQAALALAALLAMLAPTGEASAQAFRKWYLAEGATGLSADFVEEILIANPGPKDTRVRITFLPTSGPPPAPHELTVKASSRATVRVDTLPGLADAELSAVVESLDDVDIVVERTMSWPAATRRGAHNSTGVTAPATRWFLAEGSTGFFNAFVLIANPSATATARVKVTFLKPGGGTVTYRPSPGVDTFDLPPNTRYNIWVNAEVPELDGQAFSTVVETVGGAGVIVERAMYWNTETAFEGGHNSVGVTQSAMTWLFAEGTTRAIPGLAFDTFLLLSNPNAQAARARVSFFTAPGVAPLVREYPLPANSRENVWVNRIPELANRDFSMKVESIAPAGGTARPLVAERAMYWGPGSGPVTPYWVDGHNTPGVTAEAKKWVFAEGLEDRFADMPGLSADTYVLVSNSSDRTLALRATFVRQDGTGIVREFQVGARSRFTIAGYEFPELTNQRFATFLESINDVPFVAERAVYWGAGFFAGHASAGIPWTGTIAAPPATPLPTVTGITPASGPTAGGTAITITGTNFTTGAGVTIGGVPATGVTVQNATTITAVSGSLASTSDVVADVVVANNGVTRTLAGAFTYIAPKPPEITSVTPGSGPSTGGTVVTIAGRNFNPTSVIVSFGGVAATVTEATPTSLKVTTPPRAVPQSATSLLVDVRVDTNGHSATSPGAFRYVPFTLVDTILAFGDSITAGWTNCFFDEDDGKRGCDFGDGGYPSYRGQPPPDSRLQERLRARYPSQAAVITVENRGEAGEWTADGLRRLPPLLTAAQDLVIIMEGMNDASAEIPVSVVSRNLRDMVRAAKQAGKWVILSTVTPVVAHVQNPDPALIAAYNAEIVRIAADERVILADLHAVVGEQAGYLSDDGMHPSNAGYRRMAEYLFALISQNFETVAPPR
jgi:lysophospholipase L1-like esterase